ncbi:hypothetical protein BH23PLA1_BH23PLA1_41310 [soil metagenome]
MASVGNSPEFCERMMTKFESRYSKRLLQKCAYFYRYTAPPARSGAKPGRGFPAPGENLLKSMPDMFRHLDKEITRAMEVPTQRNHVTQPSTRATAPLVRVGSIPCRLEIWTDAEYHTRKDTCRPAAATYRTGLGWVVALPVDSAN